MSKDISIWKELNRVRLIISLEQAPLSNKYHQVLLDQTQYQLFSQLLQHFFTKSGGVTNFPIGNEIYKLPDEIADILVNVGDSTDVQQSKRI